MKTTAYPPILAACALLSAPASAGASTFTTFFLNGTANGFGDALSGTFDFNAGTLAFQSFHISGIGGNLGANNVVFANDAGSTPTELKVTDQFNDLLDLTLLPGLPNSSTIPLWTVTRSLSSPLFSNEAGIGGTVTATPLPGTLSLFAGGLAALGLLGRRRKQKAQAAI
jgi:hypothetical protein